MQSYLPEKIDPWKLATAGGYLHGEIPLSSMHRLSSLLSGSEGSVGIAMNAGVDEHGFRFIIGHLETVVPMVCQRCLAAMRLPLEVNFRLGLVHSESQCKSLPRAYEPLVVTHGDILLSDLVEDELILALPIAPVHQDMSQCEACGYRLPDAQVELDPQAGESKPFAVLSTLLKKN